MDMAPRYIYKMFAIDANRINARGKLPSMNRLQKWHEDDVIRIHMSEPAMMEAAAGTSESRRRKAFEYIGAITYCDTPQEKERLLEIAQILFPEEDLTTNQWNDVEIVFSAGKYHNILVTNDGGSKTQPGGILGNRNKLNELGIKILTDVEAVELVEKLIKKRDTMAQHIADNYGKPLPEWVGKD